MEWKGWLASSCRGCYGLSRAIATGAEKAERIEGVVPDSPRSLVACSVPTAPTALSSSLARSRGSSDVQVQAVFHPLPYGTRPMKVAFTLEKDSTIRALKTSICRRFNADIAKGGAARAK